MAESYSKKEKTKQKAQKKQEKIRKIMERRNADPASKSLDDMLAYVDEDGNLTDRPPVATKRKEINPEDILLGATPITPEDTVRKGTVLFYDDTKGYGFIADAKTGEKLFVHSSALSSPVKDRDQVTFEREKSEKGFRAVSVNKVS